MDNWFSFSCIGIYHCYKISLEGYFKTTASPTDILLAVKCDLGPDFVFSSFQLCGAQDNVNVAMNYEGIIHLNQEQASLGSILSSSVLIM